MSRPLPAREPAGGSPSRPTAAPPGLGSGLRALSRALVHPARTGAARTARRWREAVTGRVRAANRPLETAIPPGFSAVDALVATRRGLLWIRDSRATLLFEGAFYGLSFAGGSWYAFQRLSPDAGRLLAFELRESPPVAGDARIVSAELDGGVHQIDWWNGTLYAMDTYHNAILLLEPGAGRRLEVVRRAYPAGRIPGGRSDPAYVHMNSLWITREELLVVFHNETSKTGRPSEIAILDPATLELRERIGTGTGHAHNVLRHRGELLLCDSADGSLWLDGRRTYRTSQFTRGLAVTGAGILVGRSEYAPRERRSAGTGGIDLLTHDFEPVAAVELPGMVQEIRAADRVDRGLSEGRAPRAPEGSP